MIIRARALNPHMGMTNENRNLRNGRVDRLGYCDQRYPMRRNRRGPMSLTQEMKMLFNVWADGQHSKTTIIADSIDEALDIFCARHGFVDHADYCQYKGLEESDLNIECR